MHVRPPRPLAAAAFAVAALVLTGCTGHGAVSQSADNGIGYQFHDPALTFVGASHRQMPGAVSGSLLDGSHFNLAAWRGKIVVVNFWGSWCAECRAEAQAMQQVYTEFHDKGVEFLGIDVRDDIPSAQGFDQHFGITYPSLFDPSSAVALDFRAMSVNATPTTFVLDRSGRVAARQSGEILYTQLHDLVAHVVAEPA
jgi:peroxiredoxin